MKENKRPTINFCLEETRELVKNGLTEKEAVKTVLTKHPNLVRKYYLTAIDELYPDLFKELDNACLKRLKDRICMFYNYIMDNLPRCENCGKLMPVTPKRRFCSVQCLGKSEEVQKKREKTNIERFGVAIANQNKEVRAKAIETCLKKYGVRIVSQYQEFKDKARKTFNERYGYDLSLSATEKRDNTKKESSQPKESEDKIKQGLEKRKETINLLYNDSLDKINEEVTFFKNNGLNVSQIHIQNIENFNKDFMLNNFIDEKGFFKIKDAMGYYNVSNSLINQYKTKNGITQINDTCCRSFVERELFDWLPCEDKINSDKKVLKGKELDIYIPSKKLAIEYDGVYWHSEERKTRKYHVEKTNMCEKQGVQLLHIFSTDDIDIWKSVIKGKLGLNQKIYARKTQIKEVDNQECNLFLLENHLQGACISRYRYGLYYNNELVSVMTFGVPRFSKKQDYELLRFCTKKGYNVTGGASKLFNRFISEHKGTIVSYANKRFSNGNVYNVLGFKYMRTSNPNYWYTNGKETYSRMQCQKHKLKELLKEKFNEEDSETVNMAKSGYFRIFDCGNMVYVFNNN